MRYQWCSRLVKLAVTTIAVGLGACDTGAGPTDDDPPPGAALVVVSVSAIPPAVSTVTATVGTTTINLGQDPNDADAVTGSLSVASGTQIVTVQAYNSSNSLLYFGRDTVVAVSGTTVYADVQLICVSSSCDGTGGGAGIGVWGMFPATESEPNDTPGTCDAMNLAVSGTDANPSNYIFSANGLASTADKDYFCITGVIAGDTISVLTYSSGLGGGNSSLDPKIDIVNPAGSTLYSDDDSGPGTESAITFVANAGGTWKVAVYPYSLSGASPPRYTVRVRGAY